MPQATAPVPPASPATPAGQAEQPVGPGYKWAVVGMLWFICFFNYADRQAIAAVLKTLQQTYNFSESELGYIGSAFMWVYALTAPFAGQVGDRFPRKTIILAGLYVWSAITGFTALCTRAWQFIAVRAAEGLGETFYFPASMSLVSDYHSPRTRSRAMSLHQTSVYAGTIGGAGIAGWTAQVYSWQAPFVVLGVLGIVLGLALSAFIREPRRNEAQIIEEAEAATRAQEEALLPPREPVVPEHASPIPLAEFLGEMTRTPTALALVLAFFGANSVAMVFMIWMPKFLADKFDLKLASASLTGTAFIQIASMVGAVVGGMLADSWSRRFEGGRIATQALGIILGAPFVFLCGWTRDLTLLMFAMTLFGLFKGIYDANIWASLYDVVPASRRGTAVGMMNMVGWIGGALGVMAIGWAVDGGLTMSQAISSAAAIYLAVAIMLLLASFIFAKADVRKAQSMS